jgi:YidC/Oxa1 family membrane protein insertase
MHKDDYDYKRLFFAIFLAALVLISWQSLVEAPKRQKLAAYTAEYNKKQAQAKAAEAAAKAPTSKLPPEENPSWSRAERIGHSPRIAIASPTLSGSINLKGARFDDLKLAKYRETVDPTSPEVVLLSPNGDAQAYFIQVGWLASDEKTKVPTGDTLWQSDAKELAPGKPVTLRWDNGQGQLFEIRIALDDRYMFTLTQHVTNRAGKPASVLPYAFLNRSYEDTAQHYGILHEGPLGVMEGALEEISYSDLREKGSQAFDHASGWLGITDKYWLTTLVPAGEFKATFSHYEKNGKDRYQVDYLGQPQTIQPASSSEQRVLLFAGAKELSVIDNYATGDVGTHTPPIPLFDRAIDFGSLYFLTKPMFLLLSFFYSHVGNFGGAILLLTIVVKGLMYPLANKSFHSMAAMRELQPQITQLRQQYKSDPAKMNQEMLAFYKREKINPASGCLPVLIQMPVFFALYKVLYVSLEMRHAPFFGWIKDLSVPDPSNLFTLFGILDWSHPVWLHLGILPILMCATMVVQMRLSPKPADPVQAKMMNWMPYFFLFLFASFPAGLVLYWTWSNLLSIIQQSIITKQHAKSSKKQNPKAA